MTTRATRSPRRRTVVALAVVLAVLAGFIVRLVDIQVVNAGEHIAQSMDHALGGSQTLYGTRGSIIDETGQTLAGQHPAVRRPARPARTSRRSSARTRDGKRRRGRRGRSRPPRSPRSPARPPRRSRRSSATRSPTTRTRSTRSLKRGLSHRAVTATLADLGMPFLVFEQHPARTYPDGAVAGNLVGFMGTDGEALDGLEMTEDSCLTATNGTRRLREGQGRGRHPRHRSATPADRRRHAGAHHQPRPAVVPAAADRRAGAGQAGASAARSCVVEVATGKIRAAAEYPSVDPNDVDASEPRGSRQPHLPRLVRAGVDVQGADGGDPHRRGRADAAVDRRRIELRDVRQRRAREGRFMHPAYTYTLAGVLIDSSNAGISKFSERVDARLAPTTSSSSASARAARSDSSAR